jgi:hypothetical protein
MTPPIASLEAYLKGRVDSKSSHADMSEKFKMISLEQPSSPFAKIGN